MPEEVFPTSVRNTGRERSDRTALLRALRERTGDPSGKRAYFFRLFCWFWMVNGIRMNEKWNDDRKGERDSIRRFGELRTTREREKGKPGKSR